MGWGLVAGAVAGSLLTGRAQKSAAEQSYKYQKEMMQHAHQWEVEDMRKAGLNPILSATGGSGAGSFSAPQADVPDYDKSSALIASQSLKQQGKKIDSDVKLADTQGLLNKANSDLSAKQALNASLLNAYQAWRNTKGIENEQRQADANFNLTESQANAVRLQGIAATNSAIAALKNAGNNAEANVISRERNEIEKDRNEIEKGRFSTPLFSSNVGLLLDLFGKPGKSSAYGFGDPKSDY